MITLILLILLGIGLAFVFVNRKKDEEKAKLAMVGIVFATLVVAAVHIYRQSQPAHLTYYDPSLDRQLASVMAERILANSDGRNVVIVGDTDPRNVFHRERMDAMQQAFANANIEVLGVVPARPPLEEGEEGFEGDEVIDMRGIELALDTHPNVDILICIAGMPFTGWDEVGSRLEAVDFFVVDESIFFDWRPLLRRGVLDGIIIPRFDSNFTDTTGTPDEVYDRRFMLVNMDNLADVADYIDFY